MNAVSLRAPSSSAMSSALGSAEVSMRIECQSAHGHFSQVCFQSRQAVGSASKCRALERTNRMHESAWWKSAARERA